MGRTTSPAAPVHLRVKKAAAEKAAAEKAACTQKQINLAFGKAIGSLNRNFKKAPSVPSFRDSFAWSEKCVSYQVDIRQVEILELQNGLKNKWRETGRGFFLAVAAWLALVAAPMPAACAENLRVDTEQSRRLTDFLKHNRLPLVSAQVLSSPEGGRSVMLSGYTATDLGKSNAEKRTRLFLNDPDVAITNRIRVRPELLSMTTPSTPAPPSGAGFGQLGDIRSYQSQQSEAARQLYSEQVQQYLNQQNSPSNLVNAVIPLIALGLAIGLGGSGAAFRIMPPAYGPSCHPGPYGGCGPNPCPPVPYAVPSADRP